MSAAGVDVLVCTLTGGERGNILNKAMDRPEIRANLQPRPARRRWPGPGRSWASASSSWGSSTPACPRATRCRRCRRAASPCRALEDAAEPLVRAVREFRPHVMLTYDENGGYPHPDHIKCHQVSGGGVRCRRRPGPLPGLRRALAAAQAVLLRHLPQARFTALHEEMERRGLESPFPTRSGSSAGTTRTVPTRPAAARSPPACRARDFFAIRDQALLAHATQIAPESSWFACPLEVQQAAWPTEDYHLARSLVDTDLPEDDLFAGVRETLLVSAAGTLDGQAR